MENWKDVVDYEGLYEVSDHGNARSLFHAGGGYWKLRKTPKILKPWVLPDGHLKVILYKDKKYKHKLVHRLELEAFEGRCPDGMEGCHNDGDPANNMRWNLRWDTRASNILDRDRHGATAIGSRNGMSKLTEADILIIRERRQCGELFGEIAEDYGVARMAISNICTRKSWKHV